MEGDVQEADISHDEESPYVIGMLNDRVLNFSVLGAPKTFNQVDKVATNISINYALHM